MSNKDYMLIKKAIALILVLMCYSFGSDVMLSEIKIQPSEEGMVLIELSFNYGYPEKYNTAFSEDDENSLIITIKGVNYEREKLFLDKELNEWMKVAHKKVGEDDITFISFELQKRVPYKTYFSQGKLYISFADVRYSNTARTLLLWFAIPVALLFTASAYFLIE
jgi:hypothetical protein